MILFTTPKLKLTSVSDYIFELKEFKHKRWVFCREIVCEFFNLPDNPRYIKFVAHSHPGVGRVKLEFNLDSKFELKIDGCTRVFYEIFVDGEGVAFHEKVDKVIYRLLRKHEKIYVECLYED